MTTTVHIRLQRKCNRVPVIIIAEIRANFSVTKNDLSESYLLNVNRTW